MSQVRPLHTLCLLLALQAQFAALALSQGYDDAFEMKSKLKIELQYADYGEYEYPEPVLYRYGVSEYKQLEPFIANFPEKRFLVKYTRLMDEKTVLGARYQISDLKQDAKQHFLEAKATRNLGESTVGLLALQLLRDSRGYGAVQGGAGVLWDISVLTSLQADAQYFYRGPEAQPVGGRMSTGNLRLKARQVLTLSTALQSEYSFYSATGDAVSFTSHSIALWLSQYLPTETAVHLNIRYYTNSAGIRSLAPSLELAQYLDWATVLWLKYRYYTNESDNVSLGEQSIIVPDGLRSNAVSVQVNREMSGDLLLYAKYRYYESNLDVQMNTYMLGFVYSF
jgi:hypothetical protein